MYQNISRHNHDISLQLSGLSSQQLRCWNFFFPPGFLGDPGYAPYVTVKAPLLVTPLPAASHCQSFGFRYLQNAPFFLGESTIFRHVFSIYPTGKVSCLPRSTSSFRRSLRASRMTSLRRAQEPPANGGSTGREARRGCQAS